MVKPGIHKKNIAVILVVIIGLLAGIMAGAFFAVTYDLPQIRDLENFKPSAVTRIYSADKKLLAELFLEKRDPVPLKIIPDYLKTALIATEDRNFYKHSGVDLKGISRAIIRDIQAGGFVEGASTITQQLSKTLFLTPRKTLARKIKEAILAFQLERRYTKNEILELYLNQVYFGSGAYGVESAARIFFGKPVEELGLAECALVAGMPKAPSRYSPLLNENLAVKRRNTVLKQMKDTGIISDTDYQAAVKEPLALARKSKNSIQAPYFVEYVKNILENTLGSAQLYKGGLSIFTTLDFELQKAAEQSVANGLAALEARMKQGKIKKPDPQSALICLSVQSGGILAMIGGKDYSKSPFNRATAARRQPGSAFKPIVYAYAIERDWPQNTTILDAPIAFKDPEGKEWEPENFSKIFQGEMTLRMALSLSKNIPAVRLMEMLGPSSVSRFGHNLGIESTLTPNLSLALGTSEVTLLELTAAYAIFPNQGKSIKPFGIMEVHDRKGRIIWRIKPFKKVAMSRAAAAIMTNMLQGVIQEGTGKTAREIQQPVAGKTGTTNDFKDALFIGFSPSIAAGVWMGQDSAATLGARETGARAALPVWTDFMNA
ncbi:MAG: penicillin-binding protein 1A, partial [Proteobacteria bacterium]|nr:penicillin-binding protein 1A [Pseudomonadota bacterium]